MRNPDAPFRRSGFPPHSQRASELPPKCDQFTFGSRKELRAPSFSGLTKVRSRMSLNSLENASENHSFSRELLPPRHTSLPPEISRHANSSFLSVLCLPLDPSRLTQHANSSFLSILCLPHDPSHGTRHAISGCLSVLCLPLEASRLTRHANPNFLSVLCLPLDPSHLTQHANSNFLSVLCLPPDPSR